MALGPGSAGETTSLWSRSGLFLRQGLALGEQRFLCLDAVAFVEDDRAIIWGHDEQKIPAICNGVAAGCHRAIPRGYSQVFGQEHSRAEGCSRQERWIGGAVEPKGGRVHKSQPARPAAGCARYPLPRKAPVRSAGFQVSRPAFQSRWKKA